MSQSKNYQNIISAFRIFDTWGRLVANTKIGLSDEECQEISCKVQHSPDRNCCSTAKLGHCLDNLGGFGTSSLVHDMIIHLGPFVHKHRMIGALAEEGIEAVHSKLAVETTRQKKQLKERIRNSLKFLTIDVFLSDIVLFRVKE